MNLKRLIYVNMPIHDGSLSRIEQVVVAQAFSDYNADRDSKEVLPETYEQYLLGQNPIVERTLDESLQNGRCDMALIHAAGGYGKSALMEIIVHDLVGGNSETIDLADICEETELECGTRVDLALKGKTVNSLPFLGYREIKSLVADAMSRDVALLVLDSMDEIHIDSAKALLDTLTERKQGFGSTDIVLFGRSELVDEIISKNNTESYRDVTIIPLNPHIITYNSLPLRVRNYLDYIASRILRTDPARDHDGDGIILNINDEATIGEVSASVRNLLGQKPYLVEMLRLAFLSSLLIESQLNGEPLGDDDVEIRQLVLKEVMSRAEASHKRPTQADTYYRSALATIAIESRPREDGTFVPRMMLYAPDPNGDGEFQFDPYSPLQRSGLVSFIPARRFTRVRFEPVWLQSALANGTGWTETRISWWRAVVAFGGILGVVFVIFSLLSRVDNADRVGHSSGMNR